jgi:hypothetical protein
MDQVTSLSNVMRNVHPDLENRFTSDDKKRLAALPLLPDIDSREVNAISKRAIASRMLDFPAPLTPIRRFRCGSKSVMLTSDSPLKSVIFKDFNFIIVNSFYAVGIVMMFACN